MQDGIIKGTGNSRYLKGTGWPVTYEEFKSMAEAGTLPIDLAGINADGWQQIGMAFAKATMLSDTTAAKYFASLTGDETVDQVLGLIPDNINVGWKKIQEYLAAGSYTWTAPDLFNGADYYIGVCIIGAGGSGGAGFAAYTNGYNAGGLGGSSGYSKTLVLKVTPGNEYLIVVGAGGIAVSKSSAGYTAGNSGGTSSFNGKTALGGGGGLAWNTSSTVHYTPLIGGQIPGAYYTADQFSNQVAPFGGAHTNIFISAVSAIINFTQDPMSCFNPFENTRILGAGASSDTYISSGVIFYTAPPGLSDAGIGGGTESHGVNGTFTAGAATDNGCGGGAVSGTMYSSATTLTSGKGGDGAVKIYVRGATI